MDTRALIDGEAGVDSEENDESFDEENADDERAERATNGTKDDLRDSSEEEEDDDDEEAAKAIREGFIVDEDEEEPEERERRKRREKKRRREEREREQEDLDEEDLDLIGEANPDFERRLPTEPKFKRLKRGHKEDQAPSKILDARDMFSDEDEVDDTNEPRTDALGRFRPEPRGLVDEFDDFIEEDDLTDDEEKFRRQEEREIGRVRAEGFTAGAAEASGLDEETLDTWREAFGDGEEYRWALDLEEEMEEQELAAQHVELKDVFEPSQLAEKLLTEEDNIIRQVDEPERFQIARKPYKHVVLTDDQFKEEALWISRMMPKKRLSEDLMDPFQKAVGKVLEFFVTDEVEVPFVFQHRKDYLIHAAKVAVTPDPNHPDAPEYVVNAEKLLNQNDLWNILEYDLKFRALIDKRNALQKTYDSLCSNSAIQDEVFEGMLPAAETIEELQDLQDYLYFQHSSHLKDITLVNGEAKANGTHRRPGAQKNMWEKIRNGKVYSLVRAFGISADAIAQNHLRIGRRQYTDDPSVRPDDLADSEEMMDPPEFSTGAQVLKAAKTMFAEEIAMSPRMRKAMRQAYFQAGLVECYRTEKGLRKIDEQHPYYAFKYLRNQQLSDIARQPDLYLKMLKAEEEGLVEVKVRLQRYDNFKQQLRGVMLSDNYSEIADAWNEARKEALDLALVKLNAIMNKAVKEALKSRCEDEIAASCREEFSKKLDQAPFKPQGMMLGTIPRVLSLSCGMGQPGRDATCWAWVEEDGRVLEHGKFTDLRFDEGAKSDFRELVQRRKPDVIGVSGFTVETRRLVLDIEKIVEEEDLRGAEFEDADTGEDVSKKLEVVIVNDEVARLYQTSDRAISDHPGFAPLTRYCVGLAKYLQNPMKEYAALGKDIVSITFHPSQQLVSQEKILKILETAMVDMVNLCGVDINDAVTDPYTANLLPYVCGLGPRKASAVLKSINSNGGAVQTRDELVGDAEQGKLPVVGPRVWNNCASFLYIEYDGAELTSDYLDNTRVHPEDYELGRKMAADALELDEEDVKAEIDEAGPGAIVRKLIKDEAQEKVNDLILEEYAEQLERNFNQRKRATLETIRAELQQPYEELRRNLAVLSTDEVFTMLTGETRTSLQPGMIVPVSIKKILNAERRLEAVLDCGVRGYIPEDEIAEHLNPDVNLNHLYTMHQAVQAKLVSLSRTQMEATLSVREEALRKPFRPQIDRMRDEWDELQEDRDREALQERSTATGRAQRVINHPLFRNFNSAQAEEFLGSQGRGDVVIRLSSKGPDHIAITWKVSDNVYQHIDVLELDKKNEFAVGETLKIGNKYTYSDLDELIVNHVKAMARKVDEMTTHEKFQSSSKTETERWLTTYTEANPKRSVYAFCINPKHPGYFNLCFKAGQHAGLSTWPVKVIPQAFELKGNAYPDMRALCNGFKLLFSNMQSGRR